MEIRSPVINSALPAYPKVFSSPANGMSIQWHDNAIPPGIEEALERLYGNLFSSLVQWKECGGLEDAGSCIIFKGEAIVDIWLFRREKRMIRVLNEGMDIDSEQVYRFAQLTFARYRSVHAISFHAVRSTLESLPFSYQRYNCLEDIVLTLPDSRQHYLSSLGNATRSYIRRYLNKLHRDIPSFRYQVLSTQEVNEQCVRDIIQLNRRRMAHQGKISNNDEESVQRITRMVRACGLIGVIMIENRICAGTINYRIGDNYFLDVIGHDPDYNDYRLGTLCCYLTIEECIARGGSEYHFLWGQAEYKYRLGGVERALDHVTVFRSRFHMGLNVDIVFKNAVNRSVRAIRLWLRHMRRQKSAAATLVLAIDRVRRLRTR